MKILLDENVNKKLKALLPQFEINTVKEMNWLGKKNGELISLAIQNNFKVFLSNDTKIKFQQNLSKYDINFLIIISKDNNLDSIRPLIPEIINTLTTIQIDLSQNRYYEIS
ncbi:MAG: DUF5615 family PIN-like protein [Ignavibacteriae bacterium]|nr:DUF5615 family PIN-like protein [Ignavibacteriota bacterium]